jgi:hypothetical protein
VFKEVELRGSRKKGRKEVHYIFPDRVGIKGALPPTKKGEPQNNLKKKKQLQKILTLH